METSVEFPQKTESRVAISSSNPTPEHISGQNRNSKRYTHAYVYSSPSDNSQDTETTWMSTNRWMDKKDVVYIHTVEYYSAIKKWNIAISDMDESKAYYTKSDRERQISYDLTYMWNLKKQNENRLIDINRWLAWQDWGNG